MSARYLIEDLAEQLGQGHPSIILQGDEAKHAATVMRFRVGDSISLADGAGMLAEAEVLTVDPRALQLKVLEHSTVPQPRPALVLVQALAKGGRDELAVQTATELGVAAVIPWQAERSIVRWDEQKAKKNQDRWQQIAKEAVKQSENPWLPEVRSLHTTHQLAKLLESPERMSLLLSPRATLTLHDILQQHLNPKQGQHTDTLPQEILLIIGPEGGVSDGEEQRFTAAGAVPVQLGSKVLRSSTAGPAALAVLNQLLDRW